MAGAAAIAFGLLGADIAQAADSAGGTAVEELVVTANKREEKLRDVAAAVSAVSGEELQKTGAQSLSDYITKLPGVVFNDYQPGVSEVVIRGISASTYHEQGQTVVGYYINEVPLSEAGWPIVIPDVDAFDLERVEVLRGPQGTLFGAATLGGLVNYIAKPADLTKFGAAAEASVGSTRNSEDANYSIKGMVNLPINDKLAIRIVGLDRYDAGYLDNTRTGVKGANNLRTDGGRLSAVYEPVAGTKFTWLSMLQETHLDDQTYVLVGTLTRDTYVPEPQDTSLQLHSLRWDQDVGFGDLTVLTGFARKRSSTTFDSTLTGYLQGTPTDDFTQARARAEHYEVRLASKQDQKLRWLLGFAYYTSTKSLRDNTHQPGSAAYITAHPALFGGLSGNLLAPNDQFTRYWTDQDNKDYGLFGEVAYDITPQLNLTVGGRWFKTEGTTTVTRPPSASFNGVYDATGSTYTADQSESGFTPKATLSWRPHEGLMAYATYSEGFRLGGANPNPPALTGGAPQTYNSDSLRNFEVGTRVDLFDRKVLLDFTVFHIDWKDIQVRLFTPAPYYFAYVTNAGGAKIDGVEFSGTWKVTPQFDLQSNVTYEDARVSKFVPDTFAVGGGYPSGTTLPGSSKWTASATASWRPEWKFSPLFEASYRYLSKAPVAFNSKTMRGGYGIMDLRATANLRDDLQAMLFVNNAFDKYGIVNSPFGDFYPIPLGSVNKPRYFGVRLNWTY